MWEEGGKEEEVGGQRETEEKEEGTAGDDVDPKTKAVMNRANFSDATAKRNGWKG